MKKSVLFSGLMMLALVPSAFAQQRNNGAQNQGGGGVMPLPEGVKSVVSIDAYNILLAEVDRDGERGMAPIIVRHVYSGGIAKLFGGGSVPTEQFVSPGAMGGGNGGNGGNRGGRGQTGVSGLGNNGGNGTFGTGFNGGNGFNTGGFNGNNGFNTGGFNGNNGFGGNTFGGGFGNGNIGAFQIRPTPRN